jgi:predicted ester cyclase
MPATTTDARAFAIASMHAMASGTRDDLARVVHPDAVNREARDEPPAASTPGPDGFWATALWLRAAFADLAFDVHEVVSDGDLVVIHNTMSGRHTGDMVMYTDGKVVSVMPPTGRRFASTQTHWFRMRDGLVVEHWANRDDIGAAQQLGWVPPTPVFLLRAWRAKRRHQ